MTNSGYSYMDPSRMQAVIEDMLSTAERLQQELTTFTENTARLMQEWAGEAYDEYLVKRREWDTNAQDKSRKLVLAGRALEEALHIGVHTDRSNARMF
jgi:WXG100 family type VII secretion target